MLIGMLMILSMLNDILKFFGIIPLFTPIFPQVITYVQLKT